MEETFVSLDLETTGLDPQSDEIIEIAAVRFRGEEVLDTFHTLVNPHRPLPYRIQVLCGIDPAELTQAPPLAAVLPDLIPFLSLYPIVGHSISFDLGFLAQKGLSLANPSYDTLELASLLLTNRDDYSLAAVASHLGIPPSLSHRALPDAIRAKDVFLALLERASHLDPSLLSQVTGLTEGKGWPLHPLFRSLEAKVREKPFDPSTGSGQRGLRTPPGPPDQPPMAQAHPAPTLKPRPVERREKLDIARLTGFLEPGGLLSRSFPSYQHRPEQVRMMQAVAQVLNEGGHLLVEASPGTGKSVAYLLPALFYSLQNQTPILISTNTINLQEQLVGKDLPALAQTLRGELPGEPRWTLLKGRGNYFCPWRWASLYRSPDLSPEELRLAVRLSLWLPTTLSGDRSELRLTPGEQAVWNRISAQGDDCLGGRCPFRQQEACFLYQARQRAHGSHLIIVNHALLLADLAAELLPPYGHLIIDEAHHLEEEATRQLGFQIAPRDLWEHLDGVSREEGRGALADLQRNLRRSEIAPSSLSHMEGLATQAEATARRARGQVRQFLQTLADFLAAHGGEPGDYERPVRFTSALRAQPGWTAVEVTGEGLTLALTEVGQGLEKLSSALEVLSPSQLPEGATVALDSLVRSGRELRHRLETTLLQPERDTVYWASFRKEEVSLCAAPLQVGPLLQKTLFSQKESAILTSATLTSEGTFTYIKERLSMEEASELMLDPSFDYPHAALVYVPTDLPGPNRPEYQPAVEQVLVEIGRAMKGQTMVLFTSHAALRASHAALRTSLEREGILVLGQGVDGSAQRLLNTFRENPNTILLGTASLWEGVDVVGEALSVLVMARLPFSVPTDPVFSARSETLEDPFNQYALPQAVLRFKQGFGRLIRSQTDRGVMVILDSRIIKKPYGSVFLSSLPSCPVKRGPTRRLVPEVLGWLGRSAA